VPIIAPLPTPYFRFTEAQFDDEATFAQAKVAAFTTTGLTIGSQSLVTAVLAGVADAIHTIFGWDLSGPIDNKSVDVDGGPSQVVVSLISTTADEPTGISIKVGTATEITYSLGEAMSLAVLLNTAGYGTPPVTP
jgi:hypothetical protein